MNFIQILNRKRLVIPLVIVIIIMFLNIFKYSFVCYLPFNIPGNQMAITIPPFGIFIESKFENENKEAPCSIFKHEMAHWQQYKRMGLLSFHYNYLKCYVRSGRINNWMEEEARKPCKTKNISHK